MILILLFELRDEMTLVHDFEYSFSYSQNLIEKNSFNFFNVLKFKLNYAIILRFLKSLRLCRYLMWVVVPTFYFVLSSIVMEFILTEENATMLHIILKNSEQSINKFSEWN